jgi:GH25 family lysozyme M1 (1,4-beta-N-acetylmuramidase)
MTLRRVVALAQASTMIMLLLPGPTPVGPTPVQAALQPAEPAVSTIYDAAGKGIGCQTGGGRYKGPGLPKDPPWPPGAEPTPTPRPSPSLLPSDDPAADAGATFAPDDTAEPEPEAAAMAFVAATDVQLAQAALATPKSKLIPGIDVSHHNGVIDYSAVKQAGHRFVFAKATQDNDFIDPMFPTNMAAARAAGLVAGAYHFFDYTLDGTEQADHFIDHVEAGNGLDGALPPVVDVECWAPIGSSIHAVSTARLRDFVERVYERTGRMPLVYTSVFMWREVVGNAEGFEDLPLWAACWGCDVPPSLAPGWDAWTFWQDGLSRIPGVGRLDGNYFSGSKKELRALKLRPFIVAGGAPATAGGTVELDLGGRDATHIRTSPDGKSWSKWSRIRSTPTATIPTEEGEYTVYAQFRNGPGLKSPLVSDSIVVDDTPPEVSTPTVSLRTGVLASSGASIPVAVRWEARDETAGLADAKVSVDCGEDGFERTPAPGHAEPGELAAWDAAAALFADAACAVTAISSDAAGNTARDTIQGLTTAIVPVASADEEADVSGDEVGVIARRGPDAGRAAILLDGNATALIDLYAPEAGGPELVHVVALPDGRHTISVEATETSDPASTGRSVVVEGYATLTRER